MVTEARPKPVLRPEYCKACGRCIDACVRTCIACGTEIEPSSGFVPVTMHLDDCNGCGLCVDACPEPYALVDGILASQLDEARTRFSAGATLDGPVPVPVPDERLPLGVREPMFVKGTHASALGALLAGCRHVFGYPITPSTEGAELMAKLLPRLGGVFLQAPSEVATINMMYGCGGAGQPALTFTSSPGFSLMLEGLSYMVGSELPGVVVNVMRAGPGLGNVGPEQSDLKLACRGLGHGNTHAIVLAPATPQEMLDFTILAFDLSFRYRNPVIVAADAYLGQMTGQVRLPRELIRPGVPSWAVRGDGAHRKNANASILLEELDQEQHNFKLLAKYARIAEAEQRADTFCCEDADVLIVACNTPARMTKGAVRTLRQTGIAAGLFRPQTIWPFPIQKLLPLLARVKRVVVVEASDGQLEDELRLALSHAAITAPPIQHVRRMGGVLPSQREIIDAVRENRSSREAVAA